MDFLNLYEPLKILTESHYFQFLGKGLIYYLAILWIALIVWTARDVINRSNVLLFQIFSILLVILFNIFGLLIYLCLRPQRTLLQNYDDELKRKATLDQLDKNTGVICEVCKTEVTDDYLFCPVCKNTLKVACNYCKKPLELDFNICPYCGRKSPIIAKEKDKQEKE